MTHLARVTNLRLVLGTSAALACFAANSLLCRAALRPKLIDPGSFTAVRVIAGAVVLMVIIQSRRSRHLLFSSGSWLAAAYLSAYAGFFSFAYGHIDASVGALILFAVVQVTMVGWNWRFAGIPVRAEWIGLAMALCGLTLLTLPGRHAPDLFGAALMAVAGLAWGLYSLAGRGATDPLVATAANFIRGVPMVAGLWLFTQSEAHASAQGLILAALSGALTSGLGYSIWYSVLPTLGATRAAVLQLLVPVLAVVAAAFLLGETLTWKVAIPGFIILSGVVVALRGRRR